MVSAGTTAGGTPPHGKGSGGGGVRCDGQEDRKRSHSITILFVCAMILTIISGAFSPQVRFFLAYRMKINDLPYL